MASPSSIASYTPEPQRPTPEIETPQWETPAHKTIEREDWPSEWEDEYSDACPEFPAPEPKCSLKVYKGYAAMSRTEFFEKSEIVRPRPFVLFMKLYNWARPLGK